MIRTILITGGARSGKSAIAESRTLEAARAQGTTALYIATAQAFDQEMRDRIATHQARRGPEWQTVQEPLDLMGALAQAGGRPVLIDCLTLWLTNLMLAEHDWRAPAQALCATLRRHDGPVVIVTNEVGMGIVPDNALARSFRDAAGSLNQLIARQADEVILAVSGLPMKVK